MTVTINEHHSKLKGSARTFAPPAVAGLAIILCAAVTYVQIESKDLLPSWTTAPAVVGGISMALAAIAAGMAWFILRKYAHYHEKRLNSDRDITKSRHPIKAGAWFIYGTGIAAMVGEGSYLYALFWMVVIGSGDDEQYCITITPATSADACSKTTAILVILLLLVLIALLLTFYGFLAFAVFHEIKDFEDNHLHVQDEGLARVSSSSKRSSKRSSKSSRKSSGFHFGSGRRKSQDYDDEDPTGSDYDSAVDDDQYGDRYGDDGYGDSNTRRGRNGRYA
ncbi:hypothetical protein JCM10207_009136 [Rhodosporidiobolus poonsookiae]